MERKSAWEKYDTDTMTDVFALSERYKQFLSDCKTERECVKGTISLAEKAGYQDLDKVIEEGKPYLPEIKFTQLI